MKKDKTQTVNLMEVNEKLDLILKSTTKIVEELSGVHEHLDNHMDEIEELFEHLFDHLKSSNRLEKGKKKLEKSDDEFDKKRYIS